MKNTTYVALSNQTALFRRMEMIANNLANMNTVAYKSSSPLFTSYLTRSPNGENLRRDRIYFVQDFGTMRDFNEGAFIGTQAPLDVAIKGDGFFVVETPEGPRYTRAGSFKLDANGVVVTSQGWPVMSGNGPITIDPEDINITIASDGLVTTENEEKGRLMIVTFDDMMALTKTHSGLFMTTQEPILAEFAQVQQGMLEQSNTNALLELTNMITVQRAYEATMQMIQTQSEVSQKVIDNFTRRTSS